MSKALAQNEWNKATETYGQMKSIIDRNGDKEWSAEDSNQFDQLSAAFDGHKAQAERYEKAANAGDSMRDIDRPTNRLGAPAANGAEGKSDERAELEQKAMTKVISRGTRALDDAEAKALRADVDAAGGYLVAPMIWRNQLIQRVDDETIIRPMATVFKLEQGQSLGAPALDSDLSDAEWTSELATGSADTVEPFGRRELKPQPLAKRILISKKLLRASGMDVEALVQQRMAQKFAEPQERAHFTGSGSNQPLGVFTASTQGISTARDTTAAAAAVLAGDDFINAKHNLKPQYWNRATWAVHRDIIKAIRKLKDNNGNYIWSPGLGPGGGLTGGLPATLVDVPYKMSEFAPNTIAASQYVAILGDFKFYWIVDALDLELQVLMELYAESNQVGYIGRLETDGMPVLEEAFSRLKMSA